jgi:hypothetical protein
MTTYGQALSKTLRRSLLAILTLSTLMTAPCAFSAERDGSVLFFSVEDLQQALSHPSLLSLSQLTPSLEWREQHEGTEQESPVERNLRWGNGLGIDGYAYPGARRPLWGY